MIQRRAFLQGLFAAPAIVAYHNIMPVRLFDLTDPGHQHWVEAFDIEGSTMRMATLRELLLPGLLQITDKYKEWPKL